MGQHGDEVEAHLPLLFGQPAGLSADDQLVGGLADRVPELLGGEGLGQEVERPQLGGLHRGLEGGVGRDHDRENAAILPAQLGQDIEAAHAGELEIEKQQIELGSSRDASRNCSPLVKWVGS